MFGVGSCLKLKLRFCFRFLIKKSSRKETKPNIFLCCFLFCFRGFLLMFGFLFVFRFAFLILICNDLSVSLMIGFLNIKEKCNENRRKREGTFSQL